MPASHFDVNSMTGRPKFIVRHSTYYILVFCHLQQLSPFKLDAFKNLLLKILSINVIKE
jgi:hypothetical protein